MTGKAVGITGGNGLPDYGSAPEFVGINHWLNTDKSLSLEQLRGKVVLVDFWTYTCINCIRTLPYVTSWYDKYHDKGFVVIGVHTPEFEFEKKTDNVQNAIKQFTIHYPVAQDNDYTTWNAYNNQYWPAEYLIDAKGHIREEKFGEGNYDKTEMAIKELLTEAGQETDDKLAADKIKEQTPTGQISPESYLGSERMQFYYPEGKLEAQSKDFSLSQNLPVNSFSLGGKWTIGEKYSQPAAGAKINYHFLAKNVYAVMLPKTANPAQVKVYLDGKLLGSDGDAQDGIVTVGTEKLYSLINLEQIEDHILTLEFMDNESLIYVFTFG